MDNTILDASIDLNKLAAEVLKNYSVTPENISVIQSGKIKTVWKVKTEKDMLCLKRLKHSYDKALFSVHAQAYVKETAGNVPAIIKDKNSQLIVKHKNQLFVLYEWIHGKDPNFDNANDLYSAIQGLARFHLASKNYKPPKNSKISSKLGRWPEQYNSMKNRLTDWKEISKNGSLPYYSAYLKCIDLIIEIADKALNFISVSDYGPLTSAIPDSVVLCHQDFGKGNALQTENGVYIIDLDGVTFDLPASDLRKIIGKQAMSKNQWNVESIYKIIECYSKINPMSSSEKDVLYIDLLFPHWFFGLVKNLFQNNKPVKPSEMEKIAKLEQSKIVLLEALLKNAGQKEDIK